MTMKNKSAAWKFSVCENVQDFRLIDSSGEFFPSGSYFPGVVAKFLEVTKKYYKKNFFRKKWSSREHLILQGYLISGIHPTREKKKYSPAFAVNGIEIV
jgi:hypothetical protein